MIDFRVYYDGGETYSGDPYSAPAFGVLVIVQTNANHGREIVSSKDYFVWFEDRGKWLNMDFIGMLDYLAQPGHKKVLFGRLVEDEYYYTVFKRAEEDLDFPARTAWGFNEKRPE